MKKLLFASILALSLPAFGYEINGINLGGKELDVKKAFPSAHCKALEWKSNAADRRCDDGMISLGGVEAKITVFLKADVIQAYDLRFDMKDLDRVTAHLKARWGAPLAESTDVIGQKGKPDRKVYKARWEKGAERAVLAAQLEQKRATIEVSRGNFPEEIYRVK